MHVHVAKAGKNSIPRIIKTRKLGNGKTRRYRFGKQRHRLGTDQFRFQLLCHRVFSFLQKNLAERQGERA
jgi:hypothetical protein